MSGFSTTGASILTNVDSVDHSLLLWRQFTQWLGGMGIIVLALAVLPRLRVGGRQLLDSELAGPEIEALSDRIRTTARRLWLLYIALTAVLATVLVAVRRRRRSTTGWGCSRASRSRSRRSRPVASRRPRDRSTEFAAATQWVVIVFMVIAGINFALVYRALVRRRWRSAASDQELRLYLGILAVASIALVAELWADGLAKGEEADPPRHLPGRLDHDDDGLRERGLLHLGDLRR